MDVRRVFAEYMLHYRDKYPKSFWREEEVAFLRAWEMMRLLDTLIFDREKSKIHLTVSSLIYHATSDQVLMNFHKKHQQWKHFGGHVDAEDLSLVSALARETKEETGLYFGRFGSFLNPPTDDERPLDICLIGDENHLDIDVRYLLVARSNAPITPSDESDDIRWVSASQMPTMIADGDPSQLARLLFKAKFMLGDREAHQRVRAAEGLSG